MSSKQRCLLEEFKGITYNGHTTFQPKEFVYDEEGRVIQILGFGSFEGDNPYPFLPFAQALAMGCGNAVKAFCRGRDCTLRSTVCPIFSSSATTVAVFEEGADPQQKGMNVSLTGIAKTN